MKIQIMSDVHIEFSKMTPIKTDADVVVLAGDIGKGILGLKWARHHFPDQRIVYVPGNHEFYGQQRLDTLACMRIEAREAGIDLLDNDEVVIDGVRFLGSTLWTDFKLFGEGRRIDAMYEGQFYLQDFRVIQEGIVGHFSPTRSAEIHEQSLAWMKSKLITSPSDVFNGPTVVVTHHLPSMLSVSERYRDSLLSACFASDLNHLLPHADLWIHGHTHDSFDYKFENTRVICNPRGYETYNGIENFDFNPALVIEIGEDHE